MSTSSLLTIQTIQRNGRSAHTKEPSLTLSKSMVHKVKDYWYVKSISCYVQELFHVGCLQVFKLSFNFCLLFRLACC